MEGSALKGLLIGGATVLSFVLGIWPNGTRKAKPAWWRWLTIVLMLALVVLSLGIKTAGFFHVGEAVSMNRPMMMIPILGTVKEVKDGGVSITDETGRTEVVVLGSSAIPVDELEPGVDVILDVRYDSTARIWTAHRLVTTDPIATLPLIPGLEEMARNIYFHVPTAWLAQLAWFVSFGYAVIYLRKRRPEDDIRAATAAGLGAIFCLLATVTGSIWARFAWNEFWNWDPRQTSILIVLIIFGAYFALRSAIESEEARARISAIYLMVLAVPVVFFMFVFPRMEGVLHPGSPGDKNIGPILSGQDDSMNPVKQAVFALSFLSFALLYFWMLNVAVRTRLLELRRRRAAVEREKRSGDPAAMDREMVRLT